MSKALLISTHTIFYQTNITCFTKMLWNKLHYVCIYSEKNVHENFLFQCYSSTFLRWWTAGDMSWSCKRRTKLSKCSFSPPSTTSTETISYEAGNTDSGIRSVWKSQRMFRNILQTVIRSLALHSLYVSIKNSVQNKMKFLNIKII